MKNKVINMFGSKLVPNKGVKYSELLEQFMTPFADEFIDTEYTEDIFEFAINAWNMANINAIMPKENIEEAMDSITKEGENISLLKKMIAHKTKKYKAFTHFIVDFELKEVEAGKDPILSIVTQEEDAYLANMMDSLENESNSDDFEENYINRTAITLRPQQPFLDWYSNLNPEEDFDEDFKETKTYLIDDSINEPEKWLKKKFDKFFMMELGEWHTNKKEWPQKRNYKMFTLWFRVEISENIYDLEKNPILKSE
jgi:hypothetical protein